MFQMGVWIGNVSCQQGFSKIYKKIQGSGLLYNYTHHTFVYSSVECCKVAQHKPKDAKMRNFS